MHAYDRKRQRARVLLSSSRAGIQADQHVLSDAEAITNGLAYTVTADAYTAAGATAMESIATLPTMSHVQSRATTNALPAMKTRPAHLLPNSCLQRECINYNLGV